LPLLYTTFFISPRSARCPMRCIISNAVFSKFFSITGVFILSLYPLVFPFTSYLIKTYLPISVLRSSIITYWYPVSFMFGALRYKPHSRGFDYRRCHWYPFSPAVLLWCKGGRYVGLTTLPPTCADCLEIWEPQPSGSHWASAIGLYWNSIWYICSLKLGWQPVGVVPGCW